VAARQQTRVRSVFVRCIGGAAAGFVLATLLADPLAGQAVASIGVDAFVLTLAPLTASGVSDLNFGTVVAGTPGTPAVLATDAGRFDLTGEPSAVITVTFTLPTVLTAPSGSIPISFGVSDGINWSLFPTFFTTFDPNGPYIATLNASGTLTIGITGTVSPAVGTLPDTYTGTITLTVSYL
jgi:hypothetical protein